MTTCSGNLKPPDRPDFNLDPTILPEQSLKLVRIYKSKPGRDAVTFRDKPPPKERFDHQLDVEDSNTSSQRGIYYAALSNAPTIDALHCCLAECFPNTEDEIFRELEIHDNDRSRLNVAFCTLQKPFRILDLRGEAIRRIGAPIEIIGNIDRNISQAWSRYFYELQPLVDGIVYPSFQMRKYIDSEKISLFSVIALYERAKNSLICEADIPLKEFKPEINSFISKYKINDC